MDLTGLRTNGAPVCHNLFIIHLNNLRTSDLLIFNRTEEASDFRPENEKTGEQEEHGRLESPVLAVFMSESAEAIQVVGLHKKFGPLEVLRGVSLSARQGDVIAIIGGSGSGKSTFLRCINMLELPSAGTITIHGETIEMKKDGHGGLMPSNRKQVQRIRSQLAMASPSRFRQGSL